VIHGTATGRTTAGRSCRSRLAAVAMALCASVGGSAASEEAGPRTRVVTVASRYSAGAFHRWMLGSAYRKLWATPFRVEELDLAAEAGGLTPVRRVGGQQTRGLALRGGDGRDYTFRALDKDPTNILPEELRDTFVEALVQDQMAAQHPAGALVAEVLSRAAGVPVLPMRLVVMPDDARLGEFRADLAGVVGTFGEYPQPASASRPGFLDATQILPHDKMFALLEASPETRADTRALLRARLLDLLLGDFDRHRKQWRWGQVPGNPRWQPFPEDRDQAFSRYEGVLPAAVSRYVPQIQSFGPRYGSVSDLTYNGREQDRWLLPELGREAWREVAAEVQARLTDEVIEAAARRLPPEWFAIDGPRLIADLRARRDALPEAALRFFLHLAAQVDVQGTDAREQARVTRMPSGELDVEVAPIGADGSPGPAFFRRRFLPGETREVRLYLRGGDDRAVVVGPAGPIRVRVLGGPGDDRLDDSGGGGTRFYDFEGSDHVDRGPGTHWDKRSYRTPPGPRNAPWIPPRDWGREWYPLPALGYSSDYGVFAGAGFVTQGYGFRHHPWADQHALTAGWAFGASQPKLEYRGEFRRENSRAYTGLNARFSGLEVLRYYGFGNDTTAELADDFYKVRQKQVAFAPSLSVPLGGKVDLALAPLVQYSSTEEGDRLVNEEAPYGSGNFGQVGVLARLRLDTRRPLLAGASGVRLPVQGDSPAGGYPVGGAYLEARGAVFPKAWDVESTFGWVEARASTYLTTASKGRLTLALRSGGRRVFGRYPFHEAASLGGGGLFGGADTLRGYRANRFIGDASLYGNADLRLYISSFFAALPGEWGLLAFADAGRVWLEGETSDTWHSSYGGGLWFGLLARRNAIAISVARSDERTSLTVRAGFSF
jgi:hypothetical protein